jgi:hypothetical protein
MDVERGWSATLAVGVFVLTSVVPTNPTRAIFLATGRTIRLSSAFYKHWRFRTIDSRRYAVRALDWTRMLQHRS